MAELGLGDVYPRPFEAQSSSFADVLRRSVPDAVPQWLAGRTSESPFHDQVVEGTTVLAVLYEGGVIIAGDRRATAGNLISKTDMRKVFPADHRSAMEILLVQLARPRMGDVRPVHTRVRSSKR